MGTYVVPVKAEVTMGIVVNSPSSKEAEREARRYFKKEYEDNPDRMAIEGKYVTGTALIVASDIINAATPQPRKEHGGQEKLHQSEG